MLMYIPKKVWLLSFALFFFPTTSSRLQQKVCIRGNWQFFYRKNYFQLFQMPKEMLTFLGNYQLEKQKDNKIIEAILSPEPRFGKTKKMGSYLFVSYDLMKLGFGRISIFSTTYRASFLYPPLLLGLRTNKSLLQIGNEILQI